MIKDRQDHNEHNTSSAIDTGKEHKVSYHTMFEYAPISLWEEDFTLVKKCLDDIRSRGVVDLQQYLNQNPQVIDECMAGIVVIDINKKTVEMFGAKSKQELIDNLGKIFRDDMRPHFLNQLLDMWNGKLEYEEEGVNYHLDGHPIDINLYWSVLPGYEHSFERVLVSIIDITDRKRAEKALNESEKHFRGLFENSPISLWEEDFSQVKQFLDNLRTSGVEDIHAYLNENPQAVEQCMQLIRVIDANQRSVDLFGAKDKQDLMENLPKIFRDDMKKHFKFQLIDMWNGKLSYEREGVNYSLNGEPIEIYLHWSVLPGFEDSFAKTLVSKEDITVRKRAENYLKYLGTHDVLTGLYNRAYLEEERQRLENSRHFPVSIIVADVDGLKQVNDTKGHEAGDDLLRRAGEVMRASFRSEDLVARIGGDEFAVILPDADNNTAEQAIMRIRNLAMLNNKYYQGPSLSLSLGYASGEKGSSLTAVQKLADDRMYEEKRNRKKQI